MRRNSEFSVFIPTLPPTSNHAYGVAVNRKGKGFIYLTAEGKAWKAGAQLAVQAANSQPEGFWKDKQLCVSLTFFGKSALTYDIDGRVKLTLDAVADGLGFDDRYVFPLFLDKKKTAVQGVAVLVTDRIPYVAQEAQPFAEPLHYICVHCGEFSAHTLIYSTVARRSGTAAGS